MSTSPLCKSARSINHRHLHYQSFQEISTQPPAPGILYSYDDPTLFVALLLNNILTQWLLMSRETSSRLMLSVEYLRVRYHLYTHKYSRQRKIRRVSDYLQRLWDRRIFHEPRIRKLSSITRWGTWILRRSSSRELMNHPTKIPFCIAMVDESLSGLAINLDLL